MFNVSPKVGKRCILIRSLQTHTEERLKSVNPAALKNSAFKSTKFFKAMLETGNTEIQR